LRAFFLDTKQRSVASPVCSPFLLVNDEVNRDCWLGPYFLLAHHGCRYERRGPSRCDKPRDAGRCIGEIDRRR